MDVECPKTVLKEKLIDMEQQRSICHCMSLVGCLLNSISARFDHLFLEKHLRLASLSDPHLWVRDKETKYSDTEFLKNEVQRRTAAAVELQSVKFHFSFILYIIFFSTRIDSEADSSPNRKRSSKSFLSALKRRSSTEVNEADRFLNESCLKTSPKDLDRFPTITFFFVYDFY